jgi:hypothetical protein
MGRVGSDFVGPDFVCPEFFGSPTINDIDNELMGNILEFADNTKIYGKVGTSRGTKERFGESEVNGLRNGK